MLPAVATRLLTLTNDMNIEVKISAIYALGEGGLQTPAVIDRLVTLTNDMNVAVKIAATKALGRVSRPVSDE